MKKIIIIITLIIYLLLPSATFATTIIINGVSDGKVFNSGEKYIFNFEAIDYDEKYPINMNFKLIRNGEVYENSIYGISRLSGEFYSKTSSYQWEIPNYYPVGDYILEMKFYRNEEATKKNIKILTNRTIFPSKVAKPSAGEKIKAGEIFEITLNDLPVNIHYMSNMYLFKGGIQQNVIILDGYDNATENGYRLKIPKNVSSGDDYQIKVTGYGNTEALTDFFTIESDYDQNKEYYINFNSLSTAYVKNNSYNILIESNCSFTSSYSLWIDLGKENDGFYRIHPLTTIDYDFSTQRFYYENVIRGEADIYNNINSSLPKGQINFTIPHKTGWYKLVQTSWSGLTPYFLKTYHDGSKTMRTKTADNLGEEGLENLNDGRYRFFATVSGYDANNSNTQCTAIGFSDYFSISNSNDVISGPIPTPTPISTLTLTPTPTPYTLSAKINITNTSMYSRLKGKIMLKVESAGEAYYIHPSTQEMHYLGRPDDAFSVMREQGVGITNDNLEKIPVGLGNLTGADADGDGLPDLFEDAIGTDKNNIDSDGDGYNDKEEINSGNSPKGVGKLNLDNNFSNSLKGKIFLQVERNGEAWYINPNDGKRYFLGRPADAFQVMRNLGLGISNSDFGKL